MTNVEREREKFHDWTVECEMYNVQDSISFSLWQINKTLEKLIKVTKEKA